MRKREDHWQRQLHPGKLKVVCMVECKLHYVAEEALARLVKARLGSDRIHN